MDFKRLHLVGFLVVSLLASWASSSRDSDAIFEAYASTGRSLLQTQTSCPVDFENQNYTVITSRCRGPKFPAETCCSALKEFACPFVDEIDDLTTNCATVMFTYISLYGKYPPGLFANECREDKTKGLDCSNVTSYKVANSPKKNGADMAFVPPSLAVLSCIALLLFTLL